MLVLLNPRGGKGKALQLFWSHVQPLLAQADVSFTLMLTGECLPRSGRGEHPQPGNPRLQPPTLIATPSAQSGGTTPGSWCVPRTCDAGTRWWSCLETG